MATPCEFCIGTVEPWMDDSDLLLADVPQLADTAELSVFIDEDSSLCLFAYSMDGKILARRQISYCPICGQKLGKEEEGRDEQSANVSD